MESFEQRYGWYLEMLRDEPALGMSELAAVERQIRRLNHDFEHAELASGQRLELIALRNEAMTHLAAAQHRARIDDAQAIGRSVAAQLQRERRRDTGRGRER